MGTSPLHIVFLNVTGSLGGAERVLLILLRELRRLRPGWQLTVITGDTGPLLESVRELGCHAECLPMPEAFKALGDWGVRSKVALLQQVARAVPAALRYRAALGNKLRALDPAVVQTNGFKMHVMGSLACPATARLIWHLHDFVSNRVAMKNLLRWLSGRPAAVVAISESVAKDLVHVIRNSGKVRIIWNSVSLERSFLQPSAGGDIRIGLVSTFARWKGHQVFLQALALLPKDLAWLGFIVGGEVYSRAASQYTEAELRHNAAELGLLDRLEFTGFLADPAAFIQSLDIVVHASTEPEPFGLVIAEGMAAGKPVITSSDSIVTDRVNGFVCARGDATALAVALTELARDPALRSRLGSAARATAEQRFQPERMAREFIELYEAHV